MTSVARPQYVSITALDRLIQAALAEDIGSGDVTSELTISAETMSDGVFLAKESGVVAGL